MAWTTILNILSKEDSTIEKQNIQEGLTYLKNRYEDSAFSFGLYEMGEGYQFLSKPVYESTIAQLVQEVSKRRLSRGALETLSIIAYRQPITRRDIEQIRGVQSDYALEKLLEKDLIAIQGRADTLGRPLVYVTTHRFMDFFGIKDMKSLPTLSEHGDKYMKGSKKSEKDES